MVDVFRDEILANNPYRFWLMNETSGNTFDSETSIGDTSTASGNPVFGQPSLRPDGTGGSFAFGGAGGSGLTSYCNLTAPNYTYGGDYTVLIVFKYQNMNTTDRYPIFEYYNGEFVIYKNKIYRGSTFYNSSVIENDTTYMLVIRFNSAGPLNGGIFINGKKTNNNSATTNNLIERCGRNNNIGIQADGWIGCVADFKHQLTDAQISQIYSKWKYGVGNVTLSGTITESLTPDYWNVRCHRRSNGDLMASTSTNTGAFSFTVPDLEYYITVFADQGERWRPDVLYAVGDLAFPTKPSEKKFYYECTTSGTSGSTEPVWNTNAGSTTSDGSAIWTIKSAMIQPITHSPIVFEGP